MALALSDIGDGDGATMVIPGGHKSSVDYRTVLERPDGAGSMQGVLGAVGELKRRVSASHRSCTVTPALHFLFLSSPPPALPRLGFLTNTTSRPPELHMQKGDVLLFVDCLTHGAARRTNPGVRRTIWHRYSMAWSRLRWGYTVSQALCDRLAAGCVYLHIYGSCVCPLSPSCPLPSPLSVVRARAHTLFRIVTRFCLLS